MSSQSLAQLIVEQASAAIGGVTSFVQEHESQVKLLAREMTTLNQLVGRSAFEGLNMALAHQANLNAAIDAATRHVDLGRIVADTNQFLIPTLEHVASFERAMLAWENSVNPLFEFLRHPPDRLCCGWAHDAALDLDAPRSTPECKREAWDYLLDFTVTRLRLGELDVMDVIRALKHSGWRASTRPYEYLRRVVWKRADRERKRTSAVGRRFLPLDDVTISNQFENQGKFGVEPRLHEERLVRADFARAFKSLDVPRDAQRILLLRYEGVTADEMATLLNWDEKQVQRVLRSLNGDRRLGRALRRHFRPYRSDN